MVCTSSCIEDEHEAPTYDIYRYSPCVAAVTTLGISSVSFFLLFRDSNLESCNKLYLDFRYSDDDADVGFSYQLMHYLACFMSRLCYYYVLFHAL